MILKAAYSSVIPFHVKQYNGAHSILQNVHRFVNYNELFKLTDNKG